MKDYQYHIFAPYRVCPLGAHVDHQHGLVTGFAINKGVDLYFDVRSKMDDGRGEVYNLAGQRVAQPTTKGLYIVNGRKVVIK